MRFLHGSTVWLRRVPLPALAGSWSVWGWSEGSSFDESQRYVDLQPQYEARDELDWRSRLELMWRVDEFGQTSPELKGVTSCTAASTVCGMMGGGYYLSANAYRNFLEHNRHEMFNTPFEAQRRLSDVVTLNMGRGAIRYGLRFGLMTLVFATVSTTLTVLRNAVNPLDHGAAGFVLGAAYMFIEGPRAMLGCGLVGGLVGLLTGCVQWTFQWLSGETVGERWQREYEERKLAQKVSQMSTNSALDNMLEDHSPSINEVSSSRPRSGPAGPAPMPSELDELEADSLEVDKTYIERTLSKMKHFFMG